MNYSTSVYNKPIHYYLIEMKPNYENDIPVQDIMLAVRTKLEYGIDNLNFDMEVDQAGRIQLEVC